MIKSSNYKFGNLSQHLEQGRRGEAQCMYVVKSNIQYHCDRSSNVSRQAFAQL